MSGLFHMIFGGGSSTPGPSAPKPQAASTITGAPVAPGTSAGDFEKQQAAYWQQLLEGTGQTAGGGLPENIQSNINKQASLLG